MTHIVVIVLIAMVALAGIASAVWSTRPINYLMDEIHDHLRSREPSPPEPPKHAEVSGWLVVAAILLLFAGNSVERAVVGASDRPLLSLLVGLLLAALGCLALFRARVFKRDRPKE